MKIIETRPNGTKRVYTKNDQPSKTDQSFKMDCDVNFIVNKFTKTGQITHLAKNQGQYADVSEIPDLAGALATVTHAQLTFDSLPAELRVRFGNSPVEMVNFLKDPANLEESIKLGLRDKKPVGPEAQPPAEKTPKSTSKKKIVEPGED